MNAPERAETFIPFDNSYARLPDRFFARHRPTPVADPALIRLNTELSRELGLDPVTLANPHGVAMLAGNRVAEGAEPIAMAYAGHQFGGWVPRLGDGRAILLGEVVDRSGVRRDIQLKGAGRTPFSRSGDGRAALGPVLREYIVSEAMAALGIRTTRALAAVTTGEVVMRERRYPGAILTRVAESHVRVGTFQYFAGRGDDDGLRALADYVIARHYPAAGEADNPYPALIEAVAARQAELVARWLHIGFIHGVMNTDNMSIAGETIDYGPCAFMDTYHPETVFSSIDETGRYAYSNQPRIAYWNLACLAQALLALMGDDEASAVEAARQAIDTFPPAFEAAWVGGMRSKLGLGEAGEDDGTLIRALLDAMAENRADFTLVFRRLCACEAAGPEADGPVRNLFDNPAAFDAWAQGWRERLAREARPDNERQMAMRAANPAFIPRNHRVEEMIQAAVSGDFAPFHRILQVLGTPFADQPDAADLTRPPAPNERVKQTFCGT